MSMQSIVLDLIHLRKVYDLSGWSFPNHAATQRMSLSPERQLCQTAKDIGELVEKGVAETAPGHLCEVRPHHQMPE